MISANDIEAFFHSISTHCAQCGARSLQDCANGGQCEYGYGSSPPENDGPAPTRRDRIRAKLMSRTEIVDTGYETPCYLWTGPTSGDGKGGGYGRMSLDGATVSTHIAGWTNENGLVPPRRQLDHLCGQRRCWRNDHLELVTHKQNQKRRDARRRQDA